MRPKPIGIVGGAGPFAGLCLLDRLFSLSQSKYGCKNDNEFPLVILYSFPFSDMLSENRDENVLRNELALALDSLRVSGAELIAIACNTLHAFLGEQKILSLPSVTAQALNEPPLVLCTTTARVRNIHKQAFDCFYPDSEAQQELDEIIRRTLKGYDACDDLQRIINRQEPRPILLGCTELSLYANRLNGELIDPLKLIAEKLLEESFK